MDKPLEFSFFWSGDLRESNEEGVDWSCCAKGSSRKGSGLGVGKKLRLAEKAFSGKKDAWGFGRGREEEVMPFVKNEFSLKEFWLVLISEFRSTNRISLLSWHIWKEKKKKKESVSPCCDFKWESYIKWPGLSKSPLDFYLDRPVDHYLLLLPPHVHLLIVESDLQPIPHPWPLVKSQLHWPLIKWKLTVVYFIHVSAHPYRLVEFMIIIVSTHALKSLKGNWLWVTSSDYLSILSSKVRNDLRSPTQLLTWCTLPSIVPPRVI